jgi:dienelactone hydrolase
MIRFLGAAENISCEKIQGQILALYGDLDPLVSADGLESFKQEMRDQKVNWELVIYGNTYHAFTNPSKTILKMD